MRKLRSLDTGRLCVFLSRRVVGVLGVVGGGVVVFFVLCCVACVVCVCECVKSSLDQKKESFVRIFLHVQ